MKIVKMNDEFNLVRFNTGKEVARYRDGNPYAPENIELVTLMGPPINAITEDELRIARKKIEKEGVECIGPYVISRGNK